MEKKLDISGCFSQHKEANYFVFLSGFRVKGFEETTPSTSDHQKSFNTPLSNTPTSYHPSKYYGDIAQQQNQMVAIDRMKSIDKLISEIVYTHNHSLAVINNYIYGCIRRLETKRFNTDDIIHNLKKVCSQSKHLADVILNLKSLTTKSIYRYESVCMNALIQETLNLIQYETLEFPIEIQFEPCKDLPWVKIDKMHIQHVILNLSCNAIEALRDANIRFPKLTFEVFPSTEQENFIEILIRDNGPGFCQTLQDKLFNPSFTTKAYGMGLGLTVARTIIENHGGQLTPVTHPAHANLENGACFRFTLPIKSVT